MQAEEPTQPPAPAAEKITLRGLFMKQASYQESDIQAMAQEFMDKNPNVTVEADFVSYEALHDKIVTAAAVKAGTCDVLFLYYNEEMLKAAGYENPPRTIKDYGKMIADMGGADVCYGGIGWCGHIVFWEADLGKEFGDDLEAFKKAGADRGRQGTQCLAGRLHRRRGFVAEIHRPPMRPRAGKHARPRFAPANRPGHVYDVRPGVRRREIHMA